MAVGITQMIILELIIDQGLSSSVRYMGNGLQLHSLEIPNGHYL